MRLPRHPHAIFKLLSVFIYLSLARPAPAWAEDPKIPFERYNLANGLEIILHQDRSVPLVGVDLWYHVGSGNEGPGMSGFAHLFEHMRFQASEHVGEDRYFEILRRAGASVVNGTTSTDRTNYFEVLPSNQIETALWLNSDQMGYFLPTLTEKSLHNQIDVVRNERRQHYDNVPYGRTQFAIAAALYPEGHPYRYLVIGKHEDVQNAKLEDVRDFYRKWYVPANATLVLAGDFNIAEAKRLINKWFGSFPPTHKPARRTVPAPKITQTKRVQVEDSFAKLRRIDYVWLTPALYADGDAECDVLAHTLGAKGTGRLYRILVYKKQLAQQVDVYQSSQGFSSTFTISVTLKSDADLAEVKRIVDTEVAKLTTEPITASELKRTIVSVESHFIWGLEPLLARAELLQTYNHYLGRPDAISWDLDRYRKTTVEKVRATAATYLGKNQRVEVLTVPKPEGTPQ